MASVGYSLVAVCGFLVVASLVEQRLQGTRASVVAVMCSTVVAPGLESTGSAIVARGLSCFEACGVFSDQRWHLWLPHWQADSLPLSRQGSPISAC